MSEPSARSDLKEELEIERGANRLLAEANQKLRAELDFQKQVVNALVVQAGKAIQFVQTTCIHNEIGVSPYRAQMGDLGKAVAENMTMLAKSLDPTMRHCTRSPFYAQFRQLQQQGELKAAQTGGILQPTQDLSIKPPTAPQSHHLIQQQQQQLAKQQHIQALHRQQQQQEMRKQQQLQQQLAFQLMQREQDLQYSQILQQQRLHDGAQVCVNCGHSDRMVSRYLYCGHYHCAVCVFHPCKLCAQRNQGGIKHAQWHPQCDGCHLSMATVERRSDGRDLCKRCFGLSAPRTLPTSLGKAAPTTIVLTDEFPEPPTPNPYATDEMPDPCEVCYDAAKNTACVPCGHRFCASCAVLTTDCMICRAHVTNRITV